MKVTGVNLLQQNHQQEVTVKLELGKVQQLIFAIIEQTESYAEDIINLQAEDNHEEEIAWLEYQIVSNQQTIKLVQQQVEFTWIEIK